MALQSKHPTFESVYRQMKHWIKAFRLRTLPLGILAIVMGSVFAYADGQFSWLIFALTLLTTILLQILSNVANDYGDSVNGADNEFREGPERQTQIANISSAAMKRAMIILAVLAVASGITLLILSSVSLKTLLLFLALGLVCVAAAIRYTAGDNPYGYAGLGDVSVLIFFGWVGILGSYYLQTMSFNWQYILPASSCGLFMVGVLNINNIRDIYSDQKAGKYSIPVRLGRDKAVLYHWGLLAVGLTLTIIFVVMNYRGALQFLFLITLPLLIYNGKSVSEKKEAMQLDPYLKQMVLTTIVFVLSFSAGHLVSYI